MLKDVVSEYKQNEITTSIVELLDNFANEVIKNNVQDPFWIDIARGIFKLLLLSNLKEENEITISLLINQTQTIDETKNIINENIDSLNIPTLQNIIKITEAFLKNDNDKPLKSVVEIIYNSLLSYDKK